ncbi:MAG: hypothetical protein ACOZCO_03540 [Bacteroidota bacterium]
MNKLKKYLNSLAQWKQFLLRMIYPIVLYSIIHFLCKAAGVEDLRPFQLVFIGIWSVSEYYFFLTRNKEK